MSLQLHLLATQHYHLHHHGTTCVVELVQLLNCMEMLVEEQKMRRMYTGFMIASFIVTIVTVAAITGLSVAVGEKLKDTKVRLVSARVQGSMHWMHIQSIAHCLTVYISWSLGTAWAQHAASCMLL